MSLLRGFEISYVTVPTSEIISLNEGFFYTIVNFWFGLWLFPTYGHADTPPQKWSPSKSGYEWCGVF